LYEDNLRAMVVAVRGAGASPLLLTLSTVVRPEMSAEELRQANVFFPYFPSAYALGDFLEPVAACNASVHRIGTELDVPVVDVGRVFREFPDPRPYFWDTMHNSERGMAVLARVLLLGLEREGLLGESRGGRPAGRRGG
jgi:hypothetical protein